MISKTLFKSTIESRHLFELALNAGSHGLSHVKFHQNDDNKISIIDKTNSKDKIDKQINNDAKQTILIDKVEGKIEFKNVVFKYPHSKFRLKANFVISAKTSVAFIGKSSSGKSTILELLLRFYDP